MAVGDGAVNRRRGIKGFMQRNLLTILTVFGVLAGTALGCALRSAQGKWTERDVMYLQFPGELFLRMLKCLIVPLLVSSIVSAIGSLDLSMSGRIGFRAIVFYMVTTVCAVILGIIMVTVIRPGVGAANVTTENTDKTRNVHTADTILDLIRNVFPPNLIQAAIAQYRTELTLPPNTSLFINGVERNISINDFNLGSKYVDGTNVLGLVMFSVVLGITIGKMGPAARPIQDFFVALSEAMMIITNWVIWVSPIGVFFLVAAKLMEINSFQEIVGQLGFYFMTVLGGLFLHGFGTLTVIFYLATRKLPFSYIAQMGQVLATAFGTASSSATMPITIGCCDKMGLDPRVSRFVIPIGATINMDGTALYEAVAAIFIAQLRSVPLSFGNIVAICVTATAASIGAAGIPQAGLVTMVMVLDTVGLPAKDVTIIIAVDWLLDRFRTTINVMCDMLGAIIVVHLSKSDIQRDLDADVAAAEPHELLVLEKANDDK